MDWCQGDNKSALPALPVELPGRALPARGRPAGFDHPGRLKELSTSRNQTEARRVAAVIRALGD